MTQIRFPRPLAFVFSGGLARSASQIGMCEVANELGIIPDLVVGSSTGAINAAVFAKDPERFGTEARLLWEGVAQDKALSSIWRSTLRGLAGSGSTRTQTMLRKHLHHVFHDMEHGDLSIEFLAVATDLSTGHSAPVRNLNIVDSLIASAAFPVVMAPTPDGGDLLIDGSVVAGVPVGQALAAGAKSIIVFDTGASGVGDDEVISLGWYEVLALAFTHLIRGQADHDLALAAMSVPVVVISQTTGSPFSLRRAVDGIDEGRRLASEVLLEFAPHHGKEYRKIGKPGLYGNYSLEPT
ncbi:MAG: patatin-like phospholipase family protein [Candidatus Nanopelagicales bacterium]